MISKQIKKLIIVTFENVSLQLYAYFISRKNLGVDCERLFQAISNHEKRVQHPLGLNRTIFKRWVNDNGNKTIPIREKGKKGRKSK